MKVFLTGVTGYIGSAIAGNLAVNGHHVIGLVRSGGKSGAVSKNNVELLVGDMNDATTIRKGIAMADAVVHAAFGHDDWMQMEASFVRDQAIVSTMLDALAGSGRPFVYTSGTGVLGDTGTELADETTAPAPQQGVGKRVETERATVAAAARGVRASVIRPGLVYGHGGGPIIGVMIDLAKRAKAPVVIGDGRNAWSAVHVEDLAALYRLVLEKAPAGSLLHAVAGVPVVMHDLASAIGKAAGLGEVIQQMSVADGRARIGMLADAMAMNKRVSAARASALGWRPEKPSLIAEVLGGGYDAELAAPVLGQVA